MKSKSRKLPACSYGSALLLVFAVFLSSPSYAVNVTFGWDPNDEPDLEGYKVYRNIGSPGPPYKYRTTLQENKLADPLNPMVTLTGLKEDTKYYVALTAYDNDGNESSYSDDVCVQVVDSAIEVCSSSSGSTPSSSSSSGGGGGSGGGVCFISTTCAHTPNSPSSTHPYLIASVAFLFILLAAKSIFSHNINNITIKIDI
jgi:hypothetical protein